MFMWKDMHKYRQYYGDLPPLLCLSSCSLSLGSRAWDLAGEEVGDIISESRNALFSIGMGRMLVENFSYVAAVKESHEEFIEAA
jgi:hypothetical protein